VKGMFDLAIPARRLSARETLELAIAAETHGWGGVWLSEVLGLDALVELGAIATATDRVRTGTAIVPITTRSITVLAMAASTLAQLAPGRIHLGVGVSTPEIVDHRHDRAVISPTAEAAAACDLIRALLRGETIAHQARPALRSTRISAPQVPPRVLLAALGPRMTEVAYRHAEGLSLNLVPESDYRERVARRPSPDFEVQMLMRVACEPEAADVSALKKELAGYLRVPVYGRQLSVHYDLDRILSAPDIASAGEAVTDEILHGLAVVGSPVECRRRLIQMVEYGLAPLVVPFGDPMKCIRALGTS
jgi:alkanesulfonate monooxygenase SsuD/methylene tetrahydromethanopterin reductase-like flavin-dependent oxidoreductase (luciferase family)